MACLWVLMTETPGTQSCVCVCVCVCVCTLACVCTSIPAYVCMCSFLSGIFNKWLHWRSRNKTFSEWEELTHWRRLWFWEGLGAGGEGDDRRWDGWMVSRTRWTWIWVNSRSWWWAGRPGVLWFMGSQRVTHDWATKLNQSGKILFLTKRSYKLFKSATSFIN